MSSGSNSPPDGFFNDFSQPTGTIGRKRHRIPAGDANGAADLLSGGESNVPKPKRIACIICRKRKLKCDGSKPSCSTCTRLGHDCSYDEVRRKSGPKRGYVKALEERLKQAETLLKTQDPVVAAPDIPQNSINSGLANVITAGLGPVPSGEFNMSNPALNLGNGADTDQWGFNEKSPSAPIDKLGFTTDLGMNMSIDDSTFPWEMIGLGLEEPLPPQETIDELHQIYFDKIHPSVPMIHKYRYLAAMNLAPAQRPPVALRYAMWTLAASVVEKYMNLRDHFYQRARKYMEADSMKGHGENMISVAHAQTHALLASYEFKMMYFPRAWMSTGAAIRMCQMMGLHRLDGAGLDVKNCLPPPRDWTEREERRRTFWMAFCEDRYASIGTGWPMTIDEKDILTNLPASDEAFEMSKPESTSSLSESLSPAGASKLSPFGGIVLMACLFGRNLIHLHRPDADDKDHDLNGEFWKRHRSMDNIVLNISLSMPSHLKPPNGLSNPNIIFTNMNLHTSTICLHQAAIYKAESNKLPASIATESKVRCITAANEIAGIMRMISHMDLSSMNPFISFCLYVAARVFVQYLKSRPEDNQTGDSLKFLLSAMNALKKKNPLTESFLVQLDVDLEGLGMRNAKYKTIFSDENFVASGANIPRMRDGFPQGRNECMFMRTAEDNGTAMDPERTQQNKDIEIDTIATASGPQTSTFDDQPSWTPIDQSLQSEENVQHTLQGLALGNIPQPNFPVQDMNGTGYGLSPDTQNSNSNRPTSNASTPSDTRPTQSAATSFSTSPTDPASQSRVPTTDGRAFSSFFSGQPDYSVVMPSTGLTPGNDFSLPETPGRGFDVPAGWEMTAQTGTGLMPVGEGVFGQLMGLGPMDPMDIGWEGGS